MEPAPEKLPPAGDKLYLIDGPTWEKLRRLVDLPRVAMDPRQFDYTTDATGVRTYRFRGTLGTPGVCANFALSNNGTTITVGEGQAGSEIVAETTVAYNNSIYLRVTLNGTTGTYTAAISTTYSSSSTVQSILLGSSDADGIVSQSACGPFGVTVCRNWFASSSPYYGFAVS